MAGLGTRERRIDLRQTLKRLADYAHGTQVGFSATPRHAGWETLGLPDLRGFTPHLRTVRRFAGEPSEFPRRAAVAAGELGFDDLEPRELWLLHDLAHVIWYDVAAVTFGAARFAERDFFLEQHLASEAFAVLLLDYHVLSHTRHRGLAVDLDARAWEAARASVRALPELHSYEMCRELVAHYLSGAAPLFRQRLAARGGDAEVLARWRDHEVSYADKQRWYVFLWWDDLNLAPLSNRRAVVEDPQLAELVWIALRLFTTDSEPAFAAHVERVAARLRDVANLFAPLPKYREAPAEPDFRFTDVRSLPRRAVGERVAKARAPTASSLFLLWQSLALAPPGRLSAGEREAVAALASSVQTTAPDVAAWRAVREIAERTVDDAEWTPQPELASTFFLP